MLDTLLAYPPSWENPNFTRYQALAAPLRRVVLERKGAAPAARLS
jgi:hypothetical protein